MQDDFFGTNVGNNDGEDEDAIVVNESGTTLKTAIGSCSTASDGLSLPPEPEGLHLIEGSMPPFTQGSHVDAHGSSTLPIGDNDSDSEHVSDDELDDLELC